MKLALTGLAIVLASSLFPLPVSRPIGPPPASSAASEATPVVVELFTSEGCSSCPPADALLARLESTQPIPGARIVAIEEHVDYWNHLGWVDPFSSPDWTARQQDYAAAFREDGEYTPQMVVGGRDEFVGSRSDLASKSIERALGLPRVAVTLAPSGGDGANEPRFLVRVEKLTTLAPGDSAEVSILVTEAALASEVARGENQGRKLHHASVLRSLRRIGTADRLAANAFEGTVALKLKPEWKRDNLTAVVLVQEKKSRHILGAASARIAN
jgi:hypothetical protein